MSTRIIDTQLVAIETDQRTIALIVHVEEKLHTDAQPFCADPLCPCHERINKDTGATDPYYAEYLETPRLEGLLSRDEIERIANSWHI